MDTKLDTTGIPWDRITPLADQISREIDTYRHRQISTFREVAIVQAIATWGIGQLGLAPGAVKPARFLAMGACLAAGLLGAWIIQIYKKRIYYLRTHRNALYSRYLCEAEDRSPFVPFYPTETSSARFSLVTVPSSFAYTAALLVVSVTTGVLNFISALKQ